MDGVDQLLISVLAVNFFDSWSIFPVHPRFLQMEVGVDGRNGRAISSDRRTSDQEHTTQATTNKRHTATSHNQHHNQHHNHEQQQRQRQH